MHRVQQGADDTLGGGVAEPDIGRSKTGGKGGDRLHGASASSMELVEGPLPHEAMQEKHGAVRHPDTDRTAVREVTPADKASRETDMFSKTASCVSAAKN